MSGWDDTFEYPYKGKITRIIEGSGMEEDIEVDVYDGVMDEHMMTAEEGNSLQTASYIISIPFKYNDDGELIIPQKGDKIQIEVYGNKFTLTVDNSEPSQLGGISITATRSSFGNDDGEDEG